MTDYTRKLYQDLLLKLEGYGSSTYPDDIADPRMEWIRSDMENMRQKLAHYEFSSEDEEIYFFKSVLPPLLSLPVYFKNKLELERIERQGSLSDWHDYYQEIYEKAENFRKEHAEFFEYCRDGQSYLDRFYFLRNSPLNHEFIYPLNSLSASYIPPIKSFWLATFLANDKLLAERQKNAPEQKTNEIRSIKEISGLKWTLSKIDLIEFIYALKEIGAFNHGDADLKTITENFEKMFEISLGNISRSFQELLIRKTNTVIFIDKLRAGLIKRIDQIHSGSSNKKMF